MNRYIKTFLVTVAFGIGIGVGLFANYVNTFKEAQVSVPPDSHVSIYAADETGDDPLHFDNRQSALYTLSSDQTIKFKKGTYIAVVDDPYNQYREPKIKFTIDNRFNSIEIHPAYVDQKLSELLPKVRPDVRSKLLGRYPRISSDYTIIKDRLYLMGDWYGAVLLPKDAQADVLRVIMHKKDSRWVVETDPPALVIGQPAHPHIPYDVLKSVNAL